MIRFLQKFENLKLAQEMYLQSITFIYIQSTIFNKGVITSQKTVELFYTKFYKIQIIVKLR